MQQALTLLRCYPLAHFPLSMHLPIYLGLLATSHVQKTCNKKILPRNNNNYPIISNINVLAMTLVIDTIERHQTSVV